jgi:hypothetical protein
VTGYRETADAFRTMAHEIVWCTVATVGPDDRPRTRILHPYWEWEDDALVGWIATVPTALKRSALERSPHVSLTYWTTSQDTATADCAAAWHFDDATCERVWETFATLPPPVGYDPLIIPQWADGPRSSAFAALRLDPYRLRVLPGSLVREGRSELRTWSA